MLSENTLSQDTFIQIDKSDTKFHFNCFNVGMILFIILSQYNLAQWGATLSYVAIPGLLFLIGASFSKFKFDKDSLLIFLLYFAYFISTLFSKYVVIGREMASFFVFCVFFVFAVSHKYTIKEMQVFLIVYILVSITVSINICYNWLTHNYIQTWVQRSTFVLFGVVKDPNYSFAYLSPAFTVSILILFFSRKKSFWALSVINIVATLLSSLCASSRAGMLAMLVSLALIPFFCTQLKLRTRVLVLIFGATVVLIAYLIIINTYTEYALKRFTEDKSGASRVEIWHYAMFVFKDNPIFGGGFNAGSTMSLNLQGHTTHSILLDILCDTGVFGLSIFLFFYFKNCFWSNWDNFEIQVPLGAACLIPLMFINGFNTTTFFFPMIFLCLIKNITKEYDYSRLFSMS